jgi:PAS domain S-box-containing protein
VLWTGGVSLVFLLGALAMILRRQVQRPIQELLAATRQVAAGQRVGVLPGDRPDEIGELAASFNHMAHRIAERDAELERRIAARTLELSDSEARLRTLLEHSPIAIVTLDADTGRFVDGNEHALHLLGVDRPTLLQVGPVELSPPTQPDGRNSAEAARAWIEAALAGGARVFEWVHRDPAGREFLCDVNLARLPASGRRLLVGALLDVTTRKQAEAELLRTVARERELGQLKSEFVSMVSHEFRTPLEVIQSSHDLLDRYFDRLPPEDRRGQLEAINRSVRRMAEMMQSVLLLSRVEAGTVSCQPAPLDLEAWCRRLVDEIGSATNHVCPIRLEFLADSTDAAAGDETLLRHIFGNLLSNAVKYSPAGAPVRLAVTRAGDTAILCVSDRGRGIAEADRARLFRAFQRGRNVGQVPGTGLGLVIVKRCVDLHGGRIRCESREGEGTTFEVRLPLFAAVEAPSDDGTPAAAANLGAVRARTMEGEPSPGGENPAGAGLPREIGASSPSYR